MPAKDLQEKKCKRCEQLLPIHLFYKQKAYNKDKVYDTWDCYCKPCRLEFSTISRQEVKRQAVKYLGGSCLDCGENRDIPSIYDFHHSDPLEKDFTISKTSKSFKSIEKELDKCILLCAVCHRIRHYASKSEESSL